MSCILDVVQIDGQPSDNEDDDIDEEDNRVLADLDASIETEMEDFIVPFDETVRLEEIISILRVMLFFLFRYYPTTSYSS